MLLVIFMVWFYKNEKTMTSNATAYLWSSVDL
jgi:hypothetical protein